MKYILLPVTGNPTVVEIPRTNGLKQLQKTVGGYIEHVSTPMTHLWVDEEGYLKGLAPNLLASQFYPGMILGPALMFKTIDGAGDPVAFSDLEIETFIAALTPEK